VPRSVTGLVSPWSPAVGAVSQRNRVVHATVPAHPHARHYDLSSPFSGR
jgi:hypothetical protein